MTIDDLVDRELQDMADDHVVPCFMCNGAGRWTSKWRGKSGDWMESGHQCFTCSGAGTVPDDGPLIVIKIRENKRQGWYGTAYQGDRVRCTRWGSSRELLMHALGVKHDFNQRVYPAPARFEIVHQDPVFHARRGR